MAKCTVTVKRGYSEKEGPLTRHLTMLCNHLEYDSSIFFFWGGGGGGRGEAFIGNHVHKALKIKCTCAMHVYATNSCNFNIYWYLTSRLCAHLYQRWHKRNCPTDLER